MSFKPLLTKLFIIVLSITYITSCKKDKTPATIKKEQVTPIDTILPIDIENKKIEIKIAPVKKTKDDYNIAKEYLERKQFVKQTNTYAINFSYPYLDEKYNPRFENFNEYIADSLLNIKNVESQILESQELLCDSLKTKNNREFRKTEYKIFLQDDKHLSILFYQENKYTATKNSYYTFKTLNYDVIKGEFLQFEDYFIKGYEEDVLTIVNTHLKNDKTLDNCFIITLDDFLLSKHNFIFNDDTVVYYFNDCIMCPAYIGSHNINIPLMNLQPTLKKYWQDRFEM